MGTGDRYGLGYERVDDDPHVEVLVDNMDATARWDATSELRTWEQEQLHVTTGERLLDVGCGLGDAALVLARPLGTTGEVVGIDASASMLEVARARWDPAVCPARFLVGDALALDLPNRSFDVARSERMLQWVTDPVTAVAELARVLRPGGGGSRSSTPIGPRSVSTWVIARSPGRSRGPCGSSADDHPTWAVNSRTWSEPKGSPNS